MSKKDAKVMAKLLLKVTISGGREIIIWGIPDYDSVINGKWNVPSTTHWGRNPQFIQKFTF